MPFLNLCYNITYNGNNLYSWPFCDCCICFLPTTYYICWRFKPQFGVKPFLMEQSKFCLIFWTSDQTPNSGLFHKMRATNCLFLINKRNSLIFFVYSDSQTKICLYKIKTNNKFRSINVRFVDSRLGLWTDEQFICNEWFVNLSFFHPTVRSLGLLRAL